MKVTVGAVSRKLLILSLFLTLTAPYLSTRNPSTACPMTKPNGDAPPGQSASPLAMEMALCGLSSIRTVLNSVRAVRASSCRTVH